MLDKPKRKYMGRKPKICRNAHPLVAELLQTIDSHPTLTRAKVWAKAGYHIRGSVRLGRGEYIPRLAYFLDLCEAAGLQVKLVPKEESK